MTWHFDPTGTQTDVYDHEGTLVAESREFSGSWSDVPDPVYKVMADEARAAAATGDLAYAAAVFADGIADDIEEGPP